MNVQRDFDRDMARMTSESYALNVSEIVTEGWWPVLKNWGLIRTWAAEAIRHRDIYHELSAPQPGPKRGLKP